MAPCSTGRETEAGLRYILRGLFEVGIGHDQHRRCCHPIRGMTCSGRDVAVHNWANALPVCVEPVTLTAAMPGRRASHWPVAASPRAPFTHIIIQAGFGQALQQQIVEGIG